MDISKREREKESSVLNSSSNMLPTSTDPCVCVCQLRKKMRPSRSSYYITRLDHRHRLRTICKLCQLCAATTTTNATLIDPKRN